MEVRISINGRRDTRYVEGCEFGSDVNLSIYVLSALFT